jgi:GT2 family glycosyltransferase
VSSNLWVVVPTYWGNPDAGIYDHPTPLDGESTLPILFGSLAAQDVEESFRVLVLVSTTHDEINEAAAARAEGILDGYSSRLQLEMVNAQTAAKLDSVLRDFGLDLNIGKMRGYANVRNMQLLIPAAMGAEVIVALDDDEIVAPGYLRRAIRKIGRLANGKKVVGLAGPYLDDAGNPYLDEPAVETNLLLDKSILMNQAMKQLYEGGPGLSLSPLAFGGNMVFHRDLFTRVGFDPGITRGEDIDYLINARIAGIDFHFDPELTILHRPPRHYEAPLYAKLRQDVIRFQYERQKAIQFGLNREELGPYPGGLLTDDFPEIALDALKSVVTPDLAGNYGAPEEILETACREAEINLAAYRKFMHVWPKAIEQISSIDLFSHGGGLLA